MRETASCCIRFLVVYDNNKIHTTVPLLSTGAVKCPHEDNKHPHSHKHSLHKHLLPLWEVGRVYMCNPAQSDRQKQSVYFFTLKCGEG